MGLLPQPLSPAQLPLEESGREKLKLNQRLILPSLESTLWDTATLDSPPLQAPLDFLPSPAKLDSLLSLNQLQQAMPAQLFQALLHQPLSPAQLPLEESGRERLSQRLMLMLDSLESAPLDLDTATL